MSEGQPGDYRVDHTVAAKEQIRASAAFADEAGKLPEFIAILKKALRLMQTDPIGWGEPEYRSKVADGVVCHGILRPVVFHYIVYEPIRSVVLLGVQIYAGFV